MLFFQITDPRMKDQFPWRNFCQDSANLIWIYQTDYDDDITDPSYKLPPQKARTVSMPNVDEQHDAAGPSNASVLVSSQQHNVAGARNASAPPPLQPHSIAGPSSALAPSQLQQHDIAGPNNVLVSRQPMSKKPQYSWTIPRTGR